MISHIYSVSPELLISGGGAPWCGKTGVVRWNSNAQNFEVMNSDPSAYNSWETLPTSQYNISLAPYVQTIIVWAQKKMLEEEKMTELCSKHPELQAAKDHFDSVAELAKTLEEERKIFATDLANERMFNRSVTDELAKIKAEHDELKAKYNTWAIIATP